MNILVFGAAGPTGRQVVEQALLRGHRVTAFIHRPGTLPLQHERLRVVAGDTTRDSTAVAEAVRGQDAVVSSLGRRKSFRSDHLMVRSMEAIVPAMEGAGVRRLILVSAFGVGDSRRDAPLLPRIVHSIFLRDIFEDKRVAEERVRHSNLEWTVLYPTLLTNGPLTGKCRIGRRLKLSGMPKVSRADVAHVALEEIERPGLLHKVVVVSN